MKPLISLDVFDTAIFREVFYPTDIFDIVEDKVGNNFKSIRIVAQDKLRKKDIFYNLIDIYKELEFPFNPKEEIKAEYDNCRANPYILKMYNEIDADFVFISDMYLPASVIRSMLEKCGYKDPQVFVSCELRALKGNGVLFKRVENILNRKISKHIGDNYQADILGAQKAEIPETEFVGLPIYSKEVVTPLLEDVRLRKLIVDSEFMVSPVEEKIGYLFSPLILSFTKAVLAEASPSQTVFFNARDSFIMYIIARWLLKTKKKIKYCRFSRKSCHLPNINTSHRIDSEVNRKVMNFFRTLRINTIKEFLETFDFRGDYSKELRELGVTEDTPLDYTSQKNQILEKFIVAIQDDLFNKARESRKNFKAYISNLGMKNGDMFVDLGHFGSMQSIIRTITGIALKGRYVHKYNSEDYLKGISEDKTSYLPEGHLRLVTGIVELIFSEPAGTSVDYSKGGKVVLNKDTKYRKEVTKTIIRGVLKGARDILEKNIDVTYNDMLKVIDRFLTNPTIEEAEFGNSKLFENGSYNNDESIVWYDKALIRKGKLKECYKRSYWKAAFKLLMKNDPEFKGLMGIIEK